MALSLSSSRRKWACRAARRGGKRGAVCRHFHVHYHAPRQVWAFSPLRLPVRFSLLPYLLILPALFLAVLAFLVCFGWFTMVYFVSSLWSKGNGRELCVSCSTDRTSDSGEPRGEEEREEGAVMKRVVVERAGDSGRSEVCVESQEIKEVFEDGFSEESRHVTMMASPGVCIDNKKHADEEEIVKEVMMFETDEKEIKAFVELDGSSEMHQQLRETPIDYFLQEFNSREFGTSLTSAKILDLPYGEGFVGDKVEMSVLRSLEILEFIDKHDTAEIVAYGSDFETAEVPSSDDSIHHDIGKEHRREIEQEQSTEELSVNSDVNRLPECIIDECQETQNPVIEHNNKLREDDSTEEDGKQAVGISGEAHDFLCDPTVLPLDSVCEEESETVEASSTPFHQATSYQDGELEQELSKNKRVESSTSASGVRDFANNHWRIIEQSDSFANEESINQEGSPENLALETAKDEDRDDNCTSTGASRRLPLIRRSPAQWWNLCGVLDAFAGGED